MESPDAYTTPALLKVGTAEEIVLTGGDVVTGHDLATGKELWRVDGLNPTNNPNYRIVASPVVARRPDHRADARAADAGAEGRRPRRRHEVARALVVRQRTRRADAGHRRHATSTSSTTAASCSASRRGPARRSTAASACVPAPTAGRRCSPTASIYITNEDGVTSVVKAGPEFQILAENEFDDYTLSSPAVSGRTDLFPHHEVSLGHWEQTMKSRRFSPSPRRRSPPPIPTGPASADRTAPASRTRRACRRSSVPTKNVVWKAAVPVGPLVAGADRARTSS